MKILIDINHPAHVHFFKHFAWIMQKNGNEVLFTTRNKEFSIDLLKTYKFNFISLGEHFKTTKGKLYGILKFNYALGKIARKFKPDVLLGIASFYASQISFLINKPSLIFDDTEHAKNEHRLYKPFAKYIITPNFFQKNMGSKQKRYDGFHELAYLHPNYFKPDPSVLNHLGVNENEKFVIMRFIALKASHDKGHHFMSEEIKRKAVHELSKYAKVFITSESPLKDEMKQYEIKIGPEKIHDALYYASLFLGESGTMTTESALLGTPAVRISTIGKLLGNFKELRDKYNLIYFFDSGEEGLKKALELIKNDSKKTWQLKRDKLINDKIDVTAYMVDLVKETVTNG